MRGIKGLRDGLTMGVIQQKYAWLLDAKIEDAVIGEKNGKIKWYEGIWYSGTWVDGTWVDGCWVDGTWIDGCWVDGTWIDGSWLSDKPKP